jgi:hypothetical protein
MAVVMVLGIMGCWVLVASLDARSHTDYTVKATRWIELQVGCGRLGHGRLLGCAQSFPHRWRPVLSIRSDQSHRLQALPVVTAVAPLPVVAAPAIVVPAVAVPVAVVPSTTAAALNLPASTTAAALNLPVSTTAAALPAATTAAASFATFAPTMSQFDQARRLPLRLRLRNGSGRVRPSLPFDNQSW